MGRDNSDDDDDNDLDQDDGDRWSDSGDEPDAPSLAGRGRDPTPSKPANLLEVPDAEWDATWLAVLALAIRLTQSIAEAQDIRQETYLRLLTTRPWIPARVQSFQRHMFRVAGSVYAHSETKRLRRAARESRADAESALSDGVPTAEQAVIDRAEFDAWEALLATVRRKLVQHPIAIGIIDLTLDGIDAVGAQAVALDVPPKTIYRERERIKRFLQSVQTTTGGNQTETKKS